MMTFANGHNTDTDLFAVAISPDSLFVATAGEDGLVVIWDVLLGGTQALRFDVPGDPELFDLEFSADGRRLLSGGTSTTEPGDAGGRAGRACRGQRRGTAGWTGGARGEPPSATHWRGRMYT